MEEMLIEPKRTFAPWVDKHKARLLENHLLTKAATLAAQEEWLLKDRTCRLEAKRLHLKLVSRQLHRATKKLRTLDVPAAGTVGATDGDNEAPDTDLVSNAFEKWMRCMLKVAQKTEVGKPSTLVTPTTGRKGTGMEVKPKLPKKPKWLLPKKEDIAWPTLPYLPPPRHLVRGVQNGQRPCGVK